MKHRVLVRRHLEVLVPRFLEEGGRVREELRLELEVPDAAIPAVSLAVGRQVDEPVARDALLPDRARQLPELGRVVEVPARLEEAERPARRHRGPAEELGHVLHDGPEVSADQEIEAETRRVGRVGDADPVVRPPHREPGVARVVEEHRVAAVRQEQRHAHVRARAVTDVRVPELPAGPEPVQLPPALTQAVEVLLAGEGKARVDPRAAVRGALPRHPVALVRLAEEPVSRGVEEREPQRRRRHLEAEIGGPEPHGLALVDLDRRRRPRPRDDVGGPRVRAVGHELDARDAGRAERERDARRALAEPHG